VSGSVLRAEYSISQMRQSLVFWILFGAPAATFILCWVFWSGFLWWEYFENPTRHLYEVAVMVPAMSIISFAIASIAQIVVYFILPLCTLMLLRSFGRISLAVLIALTPVLGLLLYLGNDHFVPDFVWYTDDSPPYQHGLTFARFLIGWALEVPVVLIYWWRLRKVQLDSNVVVQRGALL
jgi:hypothetical protein